MSLVFEVTAKTRENRSDASIEYIIVARAMQATSPLINEKPRRFSKLDAAGEQVEFEQELMKFMCESKKRKCVGEPMALEKR